MRTTTTHVRTMWGWGLGAMMVTLGVAAFLARPAVARQADADRGGTPVEGDRVYASEGAEMRGQGEFREGQGERLGDERGLERRELYGEGFDEPRDFYEPGWDSWNEGWSTGYSGYGYNPWYDQPWPSEDAGTVPGYAYYPQWGYAGEWPASPVGYATVLRGTTEGVTTVPGALGRPAMVAIWVRGPYGRKRLVELADVQFAQQQLPRIQMGEAVEVWGRDVQQGGQTAFLAEALNLSQGSYTLPTYEYDRVVTGWVTRMSTGRAELQTPYGKIDTVLPANASRIRSGAQVNVRGYVRVLNGTRTFVAQQVRAIPGAATMPSRP